MVFYIDLSRKIMAYDNASYAESKDYLINGIVEFFDTTFSFEYSPMRDGYERIYYLEKDGTIRTEYEKIPEVMKTDTELKLAQITFDMAYLTMILESKEV